VDAGIRRVAEMIGGRLLTSEPDNVNLFNEFAEYRWKVDRQGEAMGEPDKKAFDPHRLDALRYAVMTLTGQKTRAGKAA
jgi:phage terminase large subunit